jgi:hypothetical protein
MTVGGGCSVTAMLGGELTRLARGDLVRTPFFEEKEKKI